MHTQNKTIGESDVLPNIRMESRVGVDQGVRHGQAVGVKCHRQASQQLVAGRLRHRRGDACLPRTRNMTS